MRSGNTLWFIVILALPLACAVSKAEPRQCYVCGGDPASPICRCHGECECIDLLSVTADDGKTYRVGDYKNDPKQYAVAKRRALRQRNTPPAVGARFFVAPVPVFRYGAAGGCSSGG